MRIRSGIRDDSVAKIAERMGQKVPEKKAGTSDAVWDLFEQVREMLGDATLLEELMRAMSSQEAQENLEFIIQMHDLPIGGDDEY